MKKKILVCGATGFIGRDMAEYFAKIDDLEVFGTFFTSKPLDNPNIKMVKADLTNSNEVDKVVKGMDIIILSAINISGINDTLSKPYIHVMDNAVMNSIILRASYDHKVSHEIFLSCTIMYQTSDIPVKENDFIANDKIYTNYFSGGWTRVYIEKMCDFYSRLGNTKFTVIRHSNIFGPYDKPDLEKSHVF